ncbi:MAG: L,D-transpeptidase [Bacteroidales bacterium]
MKFRFAFFLALIVLVITGAIVLRVKTNKPPESEVMKAGKILSEARIEKCAKYAKATFKEAEQYYDSSVVEWKNQNEKFILFRNYKNVSEFAAKSIQLSEKSIVQARKSITNTEEILEIRIGKISHKIKHFEDSFGNFPMSKKHRDEFTKCKLLYSESLFAYKNSNYSLCSMKLDSVEVVLNDVTSHYQEKLFDYFKEFPKWKRLLEQTISSSKKNRNYVIVVDKFARELLVYKNGEIYKKYTVELGMNWIGDKMQQGDKSTPEGLYKILNKKQNGATRYYKAFLLDYPNDDDKKRFLLNKKNGTIKHNAKIGNLIEIHGNGGKGIDWTDGCVALSDNDMDEVYKLCPVGTKVTIVGSTKSMNELSVSSIK